MQFHLMEKNIWNVVCSIEQTPRKEEELTKWKIKANSAKGLIEPALVDDHTPFGPDKVNFKEDDAMFVLLKVFHENMTIYWSKL